MATGDLRPRAPARALRIGAAAVVALVATGCAGGDPGIPSGAPVEVLADAPSRTEREPGRVVIASDLAEYAGTIDFAAGTAEVRPVVEKGAPEPEVVVVRDDLRAGEPDPLSGATSYNPFLAVDLVRGATDIRPFGGRQVRGGSSLQYRVEIDVQRAVDRAMANQRDALDAALDAAGVAPTFTADVYVDAEGRITRIDLPRDLAQPKTKNRRGYVATTTIELSWAQG